MSTWFSRALIAWMQANNATHIRTTIGTIPVANLTQAHADQLLHAIAARNYSPRTHNMIVGYLKRAIRWGAANKLNPPITLELPTRPVRHGRDNVLLPEQVTALIAHAARYRIADEIVVQASLALRRSELLRLTPLHLDLKGNILRITSEKRGRRNDTRIAALPIIGAAREILARRAQGLAPTDRLFPLTKDQLRGRLKRAAKAAGITWWAKLRPHDLRHYVGTTLLANQVSPQEAAAMLRHSNPTTTLNMYAHAVAQRLAAAAAIVAIVAIPPHGKTDDKTTP